MQQKLTDILYSFPNISMSMSVNTISEICLQNNVSRFTQDVSVQLFWKKNREKIKTRKFDRFEWTMIAFCSLERCQCFVVRCNVFVYCFLFIQQVVFYSMFYERITVFSVFLFVQYETNRFDRRYCFFRHHHCYTFILAVDTMLSCCLAHLRACLAMSE